MPTKPTCVLYHYTLQLYLFSILFYTSVLPNELTLTLTNELAMPLALPMHRVPSRPLIVIIYAQSAIEASQGQPAAEVGPYIMTTYINLQQR